MVYTDKIHLISDKSISELHDFAKNIGLNKCWFEGVRKGHPHYDLQNKKGQLLISENNLTYLQNAINFGAKLVGKKEIVKLNYIRKINSEPCKKHKMMNLRLGYVAHSEWVEQKLKNGHKQTECKICGRYLFKCEI